MTKVEPAILQAAAVVIIDSSASVLDECLLGTGCCPISRLTCLLQKQNMIWIFVEFSCFNSGAVMDGHVHRYHYMGGHHGHGLPLRRHNWENVPVLREGTGSWPPDGRNSLVVA